MDNLVYLLAGLVTVVVLSGVVGGVAAIVVALRQPSGRSAAARVPAPRRDPAHPVSARVPVSTVTAVPASASPSDA